MPGLASIHAGAQDARQRTTLTIVQDALAQLPAQTSEDLYGEMSDIAGSAPESVELLAGMLVPASEGQNALVEYALNGIVNFACANGNEAYAAPVRAGLAAGLEKCGDTANKALLLSLFRLLATADDIPIFLEYAGDPTLGSVAVNALISIEGSEDAIMGLIETDGASRPLLAYAAAEKGLAAAEPYLTAWIQDLDGDADEDSDPSSEADTPDMRTYLHALACCGSEASLDFLKKASIYDYVTLLQRLAETGNEKTAMSEARKLLKSDATNIRCAALGLIVSTEGKRAQKEVLAAMKSPDKDYRNAALEYSSSFAGDEIFTEKLSRLLKTSSADVKADIINWTGANDVKSMEDAILSILITGQEQEAICVSSAIAAAGVLGGEKSAGALVKELSGQYADQAYSALLSFDGEIEKQLSAALDAGGRAKVYARRLAGERRMSDLSDKVFCLLDDPEAQVRDAAYNALPGVAGQEDSDRVNALLVKSSPDYRPLLQTALCASLENLSAEEKYRTVEKYVNGGADLSLYYPVLSVAGNYPPAVTLLKKGYDSGEERDAAFSALLNVNDYCAAGILMEIAESDKSREEAALEKFISLVDVSGLDDASRIAKYYYVMQLSPGADVENSVLMSLSSLPTMPSFTLASGYLDNPQTAYQAANAVRAIASKTTDEIDYYAEKAALEKAMAIYAAAGGADNSYAVDEIKKLLAGLQPPVEKFILPEDEAKAGFEVLFDGTDLSKWTGDKVGYAAVNGTISVSAGYGLARNLYTIKEYKDFILRFEFCFLTPGVNKGVGICTPMGVDAAYGGMCEVQILDHDDPIYKGLHEYQVHGSAYGIIPAKRIVHRPLGEWSTEEIKVVGDRVTVTVNGEVILDGDLRKA